MDGVGDLEAFRKDIMLKFSFPTLFPLTTIKILFIVIVALIIVVLSIEAFEYFRKKE